MMMLDFEFVTTLVYHMRYELLFSALFAAVLLCSPDAWGQLRGKPAPKKAARHLPEPADPEQLAVHITELAATRYSKAMDCFFANEAALCGLAVAELAKVLAALSVASVRVGRADRLPALFRCCKGADPAQVGSVLVHVMRVLASRQQHQEALDAWEAWREAVGAPAPSLALSCLVQCAVELRLVQQAEEFLAILRERKDAVARDYSAMIRLYAAQSLPDQAKAMLAEMRQSGMEPDNVAYNMVLSVCSNAQQNTEVSSLLAQMTDADVVTYNTRLKGCVKTKDVPRAFAIYEELTQAGIEPTQVTFGTLLEVCTRAADMKHARQVLELMTQAGVAKNAIVYTSLIKGLAQEGSLAEARAVFAEMKKETSVQPDVICYSVLIKAHCDAGQLEAGLALLEGLLEAGHSPDEILFNNLLAGCAQRPHVQLGEKLLADMVTHAIKPTMATFSIVLKMYSKAGAFQQSATLLETMPQKYGVVPAHRLYVQHISWCIRLRRGAAAVQVYRLLLERCPDARELDSFLTACASFNMLDTACALVEIDPGRFSAQSLAQTREVLVKKRKPALLAKVDAMLRKQA